VIQFQPMGVGQALNGLVEQFARFDQPSQFVQDEIGDAVRQGAYRSFNWQGSAGGAWLGLAQVTQLERIRLGYPGARPILVRSGSYLRTFTDRANPNHVQEMERTAGGWALIVGSRDERAPVLEFGEGPIPPRPVLLLQEVDEAHIVDEIERLFAMIEDSIRD